MNASQNKYQKIAIVGFGPQAIAISQNLRDSGRQVVILLRKNSPSHQKAQSLGFASLSFDNPEIKHFELFYLLSSDNQHLNILKQLKHHVPKESVIVYAHGFSLNKFKLQKEFPHYRHWLLAPKAIASEVREEFLKEGPLAAIYSLEFDVQKESDRELKRLAADMGISVGPFAASFEEEMRADLYSEQALLCSLIPYAILNSYQILRKKKIPKELAFLECWHESRLITKALVENGPEAFFNLISSNALIGSYGKAATFFDAAFEKKTAQIAEEIWDNTFLQKLDDLAPKESEIRNTVIDHWAQEEISEVFKELKDKLYPKKDKSVRN